MVAFQAIASGSIPGGGNLDQMAEWLRRWTANPLGSARAGSNPVADANFSLYYYLQLLLLDLLMLL